MKNLSEILDLIENFPEEEEIRRIYGYLFCRFLEEKTGLRKIDEKLKKQEISFIKADWEEMDEYQKRDLLYASFSAYGSILERYGKKGPADGSADSHYRDGSSGCQGISGLPTGSRQT